MILRYATVLLIVTSSFSQAQPSPVMTCARPEVLDIVAQRLRAQGSRATIVPGIVGERPGVAPHTVTCAILLESSGFDTGRFGPTPQAWSQIYGFTVRQARNGLFVGPAPAPSWLDGAGLY